MQPLPSGRLGLHTAANVLAILIRHAQDNVPVPGYTTVPTVHVQLHACTRVPLRAHASVAVPLLNLI